jgi:hypothetical protein
MKKIWLFDLDGTLALMGDRDPYDWSRVGEDLPNKPVVAVLRALSTETAGIGFVSGRKERARYQTELWIMANVLPDLPLLWMRGDKDQRADEIVKREIYEQGIAPYFEVQGIFDDRNKVVRMWRSLGLTCFQVAEKED